VGGFDIAEQPIQAKTILGYLPENAPAYTDMTVHGFLSFAAELRGLTGEGRKKAVRRAVEMCFLESVLHQSVETLSKGYRHRTCFAQSIIHDPPVLILDEPTDGLDPNQKHEVRTLIRRMGERKAIVFSTHILEEVDAACTRAIIIDAGRIVANGTPQELRQRSELAGSFTVHVAGVGGAVVREKLAALPTVKKCVLVKEEAAGVWARAYPRGGGSDGDLASSLYDLAVREHWRLSELKAEEGRLDDVFRAITLPDTVRRVDAAKADAEVGKEEARA
jgi:ABC-2 type transport system ATP-binding protein